MEETRITVCVPSYKRPKALGTLLEQLDNQEAGGFEVRVLNDGCDKQSEKLLLGFNPKKFVLHFCSTQEPSGLPSARNKLLDWINQDWQKEKRIIVFLDDDCEVNTKFVQQVVGAAKHYNAFAFCIKTIGTSGIVNTSDNPILKYLFKFFVGKAWLRFGFIRGGYFQKFSIPKKVDHMPGGCLIYRFDLYPKLRFDEVLNDGNAILEDTDFSIALRRAGAKIWYLGSHEIIHRPPNVGGVRVKVPRDKFYYYWKHKWYLIDKWHSKRWYFVAFLWGFVEAIVVSVLHRQNLFGPLFQSYKNAFGGQTHRVLNERLSICSPQSGVDPFSTLGGEVYDAGILREMAKQNCNVEIIIPSGRSLCDVGFGWRVTTMPKPRFSMEYYWLLFKILRRVYRKRPFSAIRIHSPYIMSFPVLMFGLLHPKVKLYAQYLHVEERWLLRFITKLVARRWSGISTISDASISELMEEYNIDKSDVTISYPGICKYYFETIDDRLVKEFRVKKDVPNDAFLLLHVGSLISRKNVAFLIDVVAGLPNNAMLAIVGGGEERESLKQKVQAMGLSDRVKFTGRVSESEKILWMHAANVFLLASLKEGFGMVVAQAAACSTPAIVSDRYSLPEVVRDGITGAVCPLQVGAWQEIIKKWMQEPEQAKIMSIQAREYVKKFSWEEAGKVQAMHIRSLIND